MTLKILTTTKPSARLLGGGGDECSESDMNDEEVVNEDTEEVDVPDVGLTFTVDAVTFARLASTRLLRYCKLESLSFISLS